MSKLVQTPPFPRTPYPFDQSGQHDFTGLDSISEWLRLNRHNEETEEDDYHPEALAFTADDWIACDGAEDGSWVVGAPDWLNESTEGITSSVREVIATPHNTESTSDSDTSSDMYSPSDVGSDKGGSSAFIGLATKQNVIPSAEGLPPRGIVRRQSDCSEVEFKMPERKRPRLDPCKSCMIDSDAFDVLIDRSDYQRLSRPHRNSAHAHPTTGGPDTGLSIPPIPQNRG